MKYARNRDGSWVDVWTVPDDFPTLDVLQKCLPGDPFIQVDDAVKNGDFVDGESGYQARPIPTPIVADPPLSPIDQMLTQIATINDTLNALSGKVDALTPPST